MSTETSSASFDVRDLLNQARQQQRAEDEWVAAHEGALSCSGLGGCLRKEKFRLLGAKDEYGPPTSMLRRWRWGLIYEQEVYDQLVSLGRRPRRQVPVEVEIGGIVVRGHTDLVMTEAVVECKTSSAWEMHREWLPFSHIIQGATYAYALNRPFQLLYACSFHREQAFDFPELPDIWEPHVQAVADLFLGHPGEDVTPYPAARQWCESCGYRSICPVEDVGEAEALDPATRELLVQALARYESSAAAARAAEKVQEAAKAQVLGYRHLLKTEAARSSAVLGSRKLTITDTTRESIDSKLARAALEEAGLEVPMKTTTFATIRVQDAG